MSFLRNQQTQTSGRSFPLFWKWVVAQQLIPRVGGNKGAVLMHGGDDSKPGDSGNLIRRFRKQDSTDLFIDASGAGKIWNANDDNQALLSLVERHMISLEDAMERSHNLDEFGKCFSTSPIPRHGQEGKTGETRINVFWIECDMVTATKPVSLLIGHDYSVSGL